MKKIMLATDFSERSDRALRRATLLARQFGTALTIIHVIDEECQRIRKGHSALVVLCDFSFPITASS